MITYSFRLLSLYFVYPLFYYLCLGIGTEILIESKTGSIDFFDSTFFLNISLVQGVLLLIAIFLLLFLSKKSKSKIDENQKTFKNLSAFLILTVATYYLIHSFISLIATTETYMQALNSINQLVPEQASSSEEFSKFYENSKMRAEWKLRGARINGIVFPFWFLYSSFLIFRAKHLAKWSTS